LADLYAGVELLSLDAGNTIIFLDHARIAAFLGRGLRADDLVRTEGEAKRGLATGDVLDVPWDHSRRAGARSWGQVMATMLHRAGVEQAALPNVLETLWHEHVRMNLYSLVPPGLTAAVDALRAAGVRVVVVSNSEGVLAALFEQLGILPHFDALFDSALVGYEKPDVRIFEAALAPFGVAPDRALHVGDTWATDIAGAHAAGLRAAMIDVHGHYEGMYPDVPRVDSVAAVVRDLLHARAVESPT
jgi:HAD superfamily hydrolase (TIGR01509 family)